MEVLTDQQRATIERLEDRLDRLPVLPVIVMRLAMLDPASDLFPVEVEKLARLDPAFAVRLLQLANRALLASNRPCSTLESAIERLGPSRIQAIVTADAVMRVFVPTSSGQRNLWVHSLQVAVAARCIAEAAPHHGVGPEEAYLAGLLHDIGRFILFEQSPTELGRIDETPWETPKELIQAEIEICGFDHAALGWRACEKWNLPDRIALLVRNHHEYHDHDEDGLVVGMPPEMEPLVNIVQQADALSFTLLTHPTLLEKSSSVQTLIVRNRCSHPKWKEPPLAAEPLAAMLGRIDQASARGVEALSLAPAQPTTI